MCVCVCVEESVGCRSRDTLVEARKTYNACASKACPKLNRTEPPPSVCSPKMKKPGGEWTPSVVEDSYGHRGSSQVSHHVVRSCQQGISLVFIYLSLAVLDPNGYQVNNVNYPH